MGDCEVIVINEDYAIKSDQYQWILCKKNSPSKTNPDGWVNFKHYGSLEQLVNGLSGLLLRCSSYESFADLHRNAKEISRLLTLKIKDIRVVY